MTLKNNTKDLTKYPTQTSTDTTSKPRLSVDLQFLADLGQQRHFRKDAIIVNEGETGDALYILLQGRVRVYSADASGKEITLGIILEGDFFGEMSLDGGTRSATVEALEPCLCAVVPNPHVFAFIRDNSEFAITLLQKTIVRARTATQAARDLALLDVYERLAQTLNHLANVTDENDSPRTIVSLITHGELAARIGASREMVSKLMKDLERGGYIQINTRQITLQKKLPARW
jgi:CRP/FNR family transcriptional regulator, cyclic AMP receptor protein